MDFDPAGTAKILFFAGFAHVDVKAGRTDLGAVIHQRLMSQSNFDADKFRITDKSKLPPFNRKSAKDIIVKEKAEEKMQIVEEEKVDEVPEQEKEGENN